MIRPFPYGRYIPDDKKTEIHIFAYLDPSVSLWEGRGINVIGWVRCVPGDRSKLFAHLKKNAKESGIELVMFDGSIYQYDHGNAKFLKRRWEDVVFDRE